LSIYGTDDAKQAPVKIDFGNEQLIKTIHLEAPDSKFQKGLGTSNCGALGIDVLRHFDYIYDPNTLSLYVRKRENNPTFDEKFYLGADIKNKDDGALINSIEEGSLLANAGLKEGDLIVEIEGVKISSTLGILGLLNLLMSTENNVPIKYKRDGKILNGFLRKH
jgi:membrane-associated protease RseP (regulator of RpoE activity)